MASENLKDGLVIRVTGGEVWVEVEGRSIACRLRGRFRKSKRGLQIAAGDRVRVDLGGVEVGSIEEILPRSSYLSRYVGGRDTGERLIVANVDRLFVVATLREPPINYGFVDRVLVSAEHGGTEAWVCLNKIDLSDDRAELATVESIYTSCGYPTLKTSALTGEGLVELKQRLTGGIYAFVGESGVGKSSLLMKMNQSLDLKVRSLGEKSGRGRHTTTYSQLFPAEGGYIADTPGIQTFGFPGSEPVALSDCFPEFREMARECRFRPCTHSHEPDCAVRKALATGRIQNSRYQNYLGILSDVIERAKRKSY
jgi:ribosome biogenesis GTPase